MQSSFKIEYLIDMWPDLFIIPHCLLKSFHILLMLCKLGLGVVLVMEVLQAASCLPTMQQIVFSLALPISQTGQALRHADQAADRNQTQAECPGSIAQEV